MGSQSAENTPLPNAPRVVVMNKLDDAEKEMYFQFLLENDIQFSKVDDDCYIANVRMVVQPKTPDAERKKANEKKSKAVARRLALGHSAKIYGRRASRPPQEMARVVNAIATRFSEKLKSTMGFKSRNQWMRDKISPRRRHYAWTLKMIEEIYRDRYEHDTADLRAASKGNPEKKTDDGNEERLSNIFPVFVIDFLSKRFGLRSLVDQHAWDLIYNVHAMRKEFLEVEIFARFLEEYYDPDDLLFFLYVHSVVEKELSVNFVNRWTSAGRGKHRMPESLLLSYKECQIVARVVFGDERDPLYQAFMQMISRRLVGKKTERRDNRRIEVTQFLHLALVEYHETRPADDEEDIAAAELAAAGGLGGNTMAGYGTVLVRSKEEQTRLYEEAERQYDEKMNSMQTPADEQDLAQQDFDRERKVQEFEEKIRRAMEHGDDSPYNEWSQRAAEENTAEQQVRDGRTTLGDAGIMDNRQLDAYLENISKEREANVEMMRQLRPVLGSPPAGDASAAEKAPGGLTEANTQEQVRKLSPFMEKSEYEYIQNLMRACDGMPVEVVDEVRKATEVLVKAQLAEFMQKVCQEVLRNPQMMPLVLPKSTAAMPFPVLAQGFKGLMLHANSEEPQVQAQALGDYCSNTFKAMELREKIETNVIMMVNYARKSLIAAKEDQDNVAK
eukprot:g6562.t1